MQNPRRLHPRPRPRRLLHRSRRIPAPLRPGIAMATIAGMRIGSNFLFEHTGTSSDALLHDQVLHTASLIAVILLIATAAALVASQAVKLGAPRPARVSRGLDSETWESSHRTRSHPPAHHPHRRHRVPAHPAQRPHLEPRAGSGVPAVPLASARHPRAGLRAVRRCRTGSPPDEVHCNAIAAVVLLTALTLPAYHVFRQDLLRRGHRILPTRPVSIPRRHRPHRRIHSHRRRQRSSRPERPTLLASRFAADSAATSESSPASGPASHPTVGVAPGPAPMHLRVTAPLPEFLILNLRNYPAWHVFLNGSLGLRARAPRRRPDRTRHPRRRLHHRHPLHPHPRSDARRRHHRAGAARPPDRTGNPPLPGPPTHHTPPGIVILSEALERVVEGPCR